MEKVNVRSLVFSAILAALVIVSILVIKLPMPLPGQQYMHIGDSFILLGALFGPLYGFLIGGISTLLADFIVGAGIYAPWSFFIHGLQGLLMAFVLIKIKNINTIKFFVYSVIISFITVVIGYALAEYFIAGTILAASASIPFNTIQIIAGSIIGSLLYIPFKKVASLVNKQEE
ncbi:MAG: ECF transporter S component [Firmicutes bacterium]|nr:ECF transporter S component [Bacillota bacterium]